ncbi:hypothetical protein [Nonomuraea sp. NPDC052634]|jgi:hypothetical protein|uniref:hypothetical protein n=1 Tax=Nonomuraea sp. NPDC052634 TaxID=3155813 RepID=UPI003427A85F
MNAEFDYAVMQYQASELRRAAAEERRARQAGRERPAERRHRSVFARLLSS